MVRRRKRPDSDQARVDAVRSILDVILSIPHGRVATYGQVARLAGLPRHARMVGAVLGRLSGPSPVPWHRVVNAQGRISRRAGSGPAEQRAMLEREGVRFEPSGKLDLSRFGWGAESETVLSGC